MEISRRADSSKSIVTSSLRTTNHTSRPFRSAYNTQVYRDPDRHDNPHSDSRFGPPSRNLCTIHVVRHWQALRRPRALVTFSEFLTATADRRMSPQCCINRLDFTTTRETHGFNDDDDGTVFRTANRASRARVFLLLFLLQLYQFGPLCFQKVVTTFRMVRDQILLNPPAAHHVTPTRTSRGRRTRFDGPRRGIIVVIVGGGRCS